MGLKRVLTLGVGLLLLLIVLPFLIPMDSYRHELERLAAERLHERIEIGTLHVALLPTPRANVGLIRIGAEGEIRIEKVSVVPDISTLFSPVKVFSRVEVKRPVIKHAALPMIKNMLAQLGNSGTTVMVRDIAVSGARLEWEGLNVPAVDVNLAFSNNGMPRMASIISADGKIKVDAIPQEDGYAITWDAQHWMAPIGPPLIFDHLHATAFLQAGQLEVSSLTAKLYHGSVDGTVRLNWAKGWRTDGKFKLAGIDIGEAIKLSGKPARVSGSLSSKGTFSSSAQELSGLADRLVLDSRFNVVNGVLSGVDMVKAASLFVREGQHGGETKFDQLSGSLHAVGKQYELHALQVSSGLLVAHGNVKISPSRKLDGRMDVDIQKGVALVTVPLQISGTVDKPEAMPTKAAMAGAVAGTAVLGPLGTALGMKAGSALGNLFGDGAKK